jgi:hypothetical protein
VEHGRSDPHFDAVTARLLLHESPGHDVHDGGVVDCGDGRTKPCKIAS